MKLNRTNSVLACCLVVVVLLTAATHVDYTQPNIEVLPDMKYTPARLAYMKNHVFANGRTLQAPLRGTIARGEMRRHFEATPEDAVRAGEELINPYQQETAEGPAELQASARRGSGIYRVFCISCHGPNGAGDGPVAQRGFPPPPSLITGKSVQMKDGQLFHILTYGQTNMPSFAAQIRPDDRWDVISYVRTMQAQAKDAAADAPSEADQIQSEEESPGITGEDQLGNPNQQVEDEP